VIITNFASEWKLTPIAWKEVPSILICKTGQKTTMDLMLVNGNHESGPPNKIINSREKEKGRGEVWKELQANKI